MDKQRRRTGRDQRREHAWCSDPSVLVVSWKWWVARLSVLNCLWKQCLLQQGPRTSRSDPAAAGSTSDEPLPHHYRHLSGPPFTSICGETESAPQRTSSCSWRSILPRWSDRQIERVVNLCGWWLGVHAGRRPQNPIELGQATTGMPCNFSPSHAYNIIS